MLTLEHIGSTASSFLSPDGLHLVVDDDHGRHRLRLLASAEGGAFALSLPIDSAMPIRIDAAARLTRGPGVHSVFNPTELQRARLVLLLRILDAQTLGLSKREIAAQVIYPRMRALRGAGWKGSAERRRTHRLVLEATRLRDDGVSELLHGRLHAPG